MGGRLSGVVATIFSLDNNVSIFTTFVRIMLINIYKGQIFHSLLRCARKYRCVLYRSRCFFCAMYIVLSVVCRGFEQRVLESAL